MNGGALVAEVAIGLTLGVITAIPLGVVNVAVLEAAARVGVRRAIGIGVGGGLADLCHAWLAFTGIGALLARDARAAPALYAVTGVLIAGYGAMLWRRREAAPAAAAADATGGATSLTVGIGVGLMLTLPNPGALLAWVIVAGAILPGLGTGSAVVVAIGVGAGSMLWFSGLALLGRRGAGALRSRPARQATLRRLLAGLLTAMGALSLGRAIWLVGGWGG